MKSFIAKLLKFRAYKEIVVLTEGLFCMTYQNGLQVMETLSEGPHLKTAKFCLWEKPRGWKWGSPRRGLHFADSGSDPVERLRILRVLQACRFVPSAKHAAYWDGKHLIVDIDEWEAWTDAHPAKGEQVLFWGHDAVVDEGADRVVGKTNRKLENLFK